MEKDVTINIRIDKQMQEKVKKKAEKLGLPISTYIRMVLLKDIES